MKNILYFFGAIITALAYINLAITIPNFWLGSVKEYNTFTVDSIDYNRHTMLIYHKGDVFSICHSPTCKKCYQVFD